MAEVCIKLCTSSVINWYKQGSGTWPRVAQGQSVVTHILLCLEGCLMMFVASRKDCVFFIARRRLSVQNSILRPSLVHILSPTSLLCWELTYWLPALPGVQAKNTHKPHTGAKISSASLFPNPQEWADQPEPGSLYTGDNALLESALLAGGHALFLFPIKLCCDSFLHLQAWMVCEN